MLHSTILYLYIINVMANGVIVNIKLIIDIGYKKMITNMLLAVVIIPLFLVGLFFINKKIHELESKINMAEIRAVENKVVDVSDDYEGEIISEVRVRKKPLQPRSTSLDTLARARLLESLDEVNGEGCHVFKSSTDITEHMAIYSTTHTVSTVINPAIKDGLVTRLYESRRKGQRYAITDKGVAYLHDLREMGIV